MNANNRSAGETDIGGPEKNPSNKGTPKEQPKKHGCYKNVE